MSTRRQLQLLAKQSADVKQKTKLLFHVKRIAFERGSHSNAALVRTDVAVRMEHLLGVVVLSSDADVWHSPF
jgi:hypothetical protein